MGIRVAWQDIFTETIDEQARPNVSVYHEGVMRLCKKIVRPDTTIDWRHLPRYSGSLHYLYPALVNDLIIANEVIKTEEEGYDAVVVGCFCDCALQACREAVRIPVMGPCESAMLLAQLLGRKFSVVTIHPHYISLMETNLRLYGWRDRAISNRPIRSIPDEPFYWGLMIDAFQGKAERLVATFEKVALGCVEDGADVVICGCAPCGAALTLAGYQEIADTGVRFVSPATAMLKLAEIMVDLRRTIGLTKTEALVGPYQTPPESMMAQIREMLSF